MNEKLHILILEDSPEDAELIVCELRKENLRFSSKCVATKEAFLKEIKDSTPNVILLDYKLPGFDGLTALKLLKKYSPLVPIIIVTGTLSDVKAANCIKAGAADYVLKDRLARLGSAVKEVLEMKKEKGKKEKLEKELQESEENYRELTDSIDDIFFSMDKDLKYTYWNKASEELTGTPSKDAIGKSIFEIFPDTEDTKRAVLVYKEVLKTKKSQTFLNEYNIRGKTYYFEISAYPSKNGVSVFVKDITERKQIEQMLLQSEKMASIGTIAAGVAHEINNPIGYIYSNLRTLEKYNEKFRIFYSVIQNLCEKCSKAEPDEVRNFIDEFIKIKEDAKIDYILTDTKDALSESLEGTEKVKKIVLDLKDFSRVEKPEIKLADINDGIEKTLNIIWNELKYKAEVIKEFGNIPEIKCDMKKLEQVFMNILVNAAQAIEKHGIIKIKTFSADNSVAIQISDTGKGIPKENIGKIFDAFFTSKEPGKGTGLGLSISYKIIEEHNGTINVESEVGKGTTFTIKLPVKKSGEIEEYEILIVDDEKDFRKVIRKSILNYDPSFSVKMAKDGFEAAELINSFKPDLVILDIRMPGMDGFEVCRKIMSSELKHPVKVVMVTGFDDEDVKERAFKAGAFEFMEKPIPIKNLYNMLDRVFKMK